ncbi:MAG TPA: AI-2E family transporter [Terriglobia bacterium]|nr:AI-2E family transporter [Terriglobia bacterium]
MSEVKQSSSPAAGAASTSLKIIAAGIVVAALYYASSVVIALVLSIFIAFVLDPGVSGLERLHIPRWLGSLVVVLIGLAAVYLIVYVLSSSAFSLAADLPKVESRLRQVVARLEEPIAHLGSAFTSASSPERNVTTVRIEQESPWGQFLLRGIGSVYAFTVTVMFIPFLVFFMLTSKNQIWAATLNLFAPERRQQSEDVIHGIGEMVRQYVIGNILVAAISAFLITPVFEFVGLPYAIILGPVSALLNLIPYIGVALAMLPPLLVGLLAFDRVGPFAAVAVTVAAVHVVAVNFLTPKFVGRRVKLNALSVTLAMMFWSALWGAFGLVLAIPITASFKAVCDNVRSLRPLGAWLGDS